ncbi:iron-sulfur cluster assembly scaffold protein [Sphingomonas paeninsulae]|uniref:Iron-sulfur cluster assembly scaffold protein n=1 Tax=Sphingomonas paeninsulae TaxID=2319844 RepID=A0A494TEB1_SPHPE|nr:iron-sulfur cluster assembly scaffold protein [Sphingomonas paeninsulae]AYJ87610.1 iron-sulfur cluster assembly scaffold protein [Sphingomonas paeninsulae]
MSAGLYNIDVLRLATSLADWPRLSDPQASAEKKSVVCGSRVTVDVTLDENGRVAVFGQDVQACALGQASAALLARHIIGRSAGEIEDASAALKGFLAGTNESIGEWPGLEVLTSARGYPARHASIRLPFEAAAEAAKLATER